ncbi:NAD(P)-dependent oxidoreductase [Streptomyces sp. NPDC088387]|uniref:NAD(P)-dependent oxidoreductase n=1 Tax=Streptomyces sp. NPDC088387 TaxID=3365859 RepID=UPI0038234CED
MTGPARVGLADGSPLTLSIARHLIAAGHRLTAYAPSWADARQMEEAGAELVTAPAQLAHCDVVINGLVDTGAKAAFYLHDDGLLKAARPGQLFVDHTIVDPSQARHLAERAARRGAGFLDVPLTGGVQKARQGRLIAVVGGETQHLDLARPLLNAYCADIVHAGPVGRGTELQLIGHMLVSVHAVAAAEAAALIARLGLPPRESKRVLMSAPAASSMLDHCLPAAFTTSEIESGATIGGLLHAQSLAADLAARLDVPVRLLPAVRGQFAALIRRGRARHDLSQLARAYDHEAA